MSDTVLYEMRGRTALITLNRPDRLNAWNDEMGTAYYDALDRAAADPDARVIVVTGAGRGFCAGADMNLLQDIGDAGGPANDGGERDRRNATHAINIPKPVIAAVNGAAAGLGLVQAVACDIRFASKGAKFTVAFSRRGLIVEHGLSWTLPRLVGQAAALDLAISGRVILAEEAKEMGLVNFLCEPETMLDEALAYADDMATNVSPTSMAIMKDQIYRHPSMPMADATSESIKLMFESLGRPDFKEGVASFVQKRAPEFHPYSG